MPLRRACLGLLSCGHLVFRNNRRSTPMAAFRTVLGLGATHGPTTYDEITALKHAA